MTNYVQGDGPWSLELQIVSPMGSETVKVNDLKKNRERIQVPIPRTIDEEGGTYCTWYFRTLWYMDTRLVTREPILRKLSAPVKLLCLMPAAEKNRGYLHWTQEFAWVGRAE